MAVDPHSEDVAGAAFAEQWGIRLDRWQGVREAVLFPHLAHMIDGVEAREVCDLGCGDGAATHVLRPAVRPDTTIAVLDVNLWTLAANHATDDPRPKEAAFPIGWDGVDSMLYYRDVEWYRRAFRAGGLHIAQETVLTLPHGRSFGARFDGMSGWPVFWVVALRRAG